MNEGPLSDEWEVCCNAAPTAVGIGDGERPPQAAAYLLLYHPIQ